MGFKDFLHYGFGIGKGPERPKPAYTTKEFQIVEQDYYFKLEAKYKKAEH